ncbi:MAG TPA: type II secretion system protein GspG [Phycisphaerae bacterium]|nr:type II secretion system protein GspG [Phycisphaerae bacterium]
MTNRARTRRAFTLIEVMLVIALVVILAGVVFFTVGRTGEGAKVDMTDVLIKKVSGGVERYCADLGHYPTEEEGGINALVTKPNFETEEAGQRWRGPYLSPEDLKDPWGSALHYEAVTAGDTTAGGKPYKIWSNGPDRQDGSEDDIRNWSEQTGM